MSEGGDELDFSVVDPTLDAGERAAVIALLAECGLDYEENIEALVVCRREGRLVACAGLECNIVKCVATCPDYRGENLSLKVVSEVVALAHERGHTHLFLYTRPENVSVFAGCGFYPLVEAPGYVTVMENTPIGIRSYCNRLKALRKDMPRIGSIVMNANPFTYGHRYLVERAAEACDWLHLFVVAEDVSLISYRDRYALVAEGVKDITNLTLHHGSQYMISRATFSAYFFKEKGIVGDCVSAIDLLLFRNYIAPALGITHRYVGTEPFCATTLKYNEDMKYWLQADVSPAAPVAVVEVERTTATGVPISASEVRRLLRNERFDRIAEIVPPATLDVLLKNYAPMRRRSVELPPGASEAEGWQTLASLPGGSRQ
ncbi:[citrate (pro-3S)-lyase] ligase [Consotaella salsifontis]|uniref:[Citrate [pro-3S]-lyase] ligase n=1 Tax=Consotaella salsifontis TaxID=1365950 RepID=A0A1T4MR15_9HYPH|nr:[citrate (pro-3S)-lyase] ligase [Consotaella salsifontis]SJZ69560.1 [citrate (pro-3S)-lyase] ligase [Consotaella salsifontis]